MTRLEAFINYFRNAGYDVTLNETEEEITVTREIEMHYADFKKVECSKLYEHIEAVKGTYNPDTKTVLVKEDFSVYINGRNKEADDPDRFVEDKLKKLSESLNRPYLMNAIKYKKG